MEEQAGLPTFWDDPPDAQRKMRRLTRLKESFELWYGLRDRVSSTLELTELAIEDGEDSFEDQLSAEAEDVSRILEARELDLTLSGPYDDRAAIVSIHSGAGGTDSQDWAEMLLRMYLRWAERGGRKAQLLDLSPGEEVGIKSASIEVGGDHAYGYLQAEKGVHRLVRLSPFDANHLRHTSFVQVEVLPAAEEDPDISVRPDELKEEFYRSSGPGGQNVQKVASAVRLTHLPTGLVVTCQNERSQYQNREFAMKLLLARLLERQIEDRIKKTAELKGEHVSAEWGNQIRSYVLHPYKMVKDHRTDSQSADPDGVLQGDLDQFINAYLMSRVGGK